jgi:hypothetical protein
MRTISANAAPEVILGSDYGVKVDSWAISCMVRLNPDVSCARKSQMYFIKISFIFIFTLSLSLSLSLFSLDAACSAHK